MDGEPARNRSLRETVTRISVERCEVCGESLSGVPAKIERRTKIDIVFEKVVEHTDAEIKTCPCCQATTKGDFPAGLHGPRQYGEGLKAFAINLLAAQMVGLLKFVLRLYHAGVLTLD